MKTAFFRFFIFQTAFLNFLVSTILKFTKVAKLLHKTTFRPMIILKWQLGL